LIYESYRSFPKNISNHTTIRNVNTEGKPMQKELQVYIDGVLYPKSQAKVSVYDHGLLYGDGVFEGIRAYHGIVFNEGRDDTGSAGNPAKKQAARRLYPLGSYERCR
jgi:Zn-dependent M16 (insulinase) family peptidase